MVSSISEVSPDKWDSCSLDAIGPQQFNPFLSHGFLSSLEESGSAVEVINHQLDDFYLKLLCLIVICCMVKRSTLPLFLFFSLSVFLC